MTRRVSDFIRPWHSAGRDSHFTRSVLRESHLILPRFAIPDGEGTWFNARFQLGNRNAFIYQNAFKAAIRRCIVALLLSFSSKFQIKIFDIYNQIAINQIDYSLALSLVFF